MKLYVDLESLQLIEGPGFRNPITLLRFKRGDAALLEVEFLNGGGTASSIGDPEELELRFGAKQFNRFDLGYLVFSNDWEIPSATAELQSYRCSPSFNTLQLDAAIGLGSPSSTELSEITLMGEITWREGMGEPTSTRTFLVVVENDVNRGTEGVPISADPAYPEPQNVALFGSVVRHDVAQALNLAAKLRARQNIGADHFVTEPLFLTASPVKDSVVSISNVTLYPPVTGSPEIENTEDLHLVSIDSDGRRVYTSSGYLEPTGYRFNQNLPGEYSTVTNQTTGFAADFDSYDDLESWIWGLGASHTINVVPAASSIGQLAILNGTKFFVATSLAPTTWEPIQADNDSLQLAHSYGSDSIVAPYSYTEVTKTYTLPSRSGAFALNDGIGIGVSGTNVILGKITGILGSSNTGMGYNALSGISTGSGNTAVGSYTSITLTSASETTAVGSEALRYNNASGNTALGSQALTNCSTGISNTAVGTNALSSITGSTLSCAMGFNAGRYITAGGNTMVGAKTGLSYWNTGVDGQVNLTTGAGNTIIGCNAGVNNAARKQAIVLGKDATALNDGELVLGAPLVGIRGGRTGTTPTGLTGAITAPTNATTPVGWLEIRINGTLFKTPLYQ